MKIGRPYKTGGLFTFKIYSIYVIKYPQKYEEVLQFIYCVQVNITSL